jgi:hypothetical protein
MSQFGCGVVKTSIGGRYSRGILVLSEREFFERLNQSDIFKLQQIVALSSFVLPMLIISHLLECP